MSSDQASRWTCCGGSAGLLASPILGAIKAARPKRTGLETDGHVGTEAAPWVFAGRVKPSLDYLDQININYREHSHPGPRGRRAREPRPLPIDLVRHEMMTMAPVPDSVIAEILDEVFLPLVIPDGGRRTGPEREARDDCLRGPWTHWRCFVIVLHDEASYWVTSTCCPLDWCFLSRILVPRAYKSS
jgi:hypothetical protein